jgi:hypothetical protein
MSNDAEESLALTLEQEMKLISHVYAGTSGIEAKEELEEMRDLIKHSPPDDPARLRAERNLPKLEEYIDLYNRRATYGVAQVIDLPKFQTISRAERGSLTDRKPHITVINEVHFHDLAPGSKEPVSDVFKAFFEGKK